jgi:hypothetical protein
MVMGKISKRAVELLNTLYPGQFSVEVENPDKNSWQAANNLLFNGSTVELFTEPLPDNWSIIGTTKWQYF